MQMCLAAAGQGGLAGPVCWAGKGREVVLLGLNRVGTGKVKGDIQSMADSFHFLFTQKPLFFQQTQRERYYLNEQSHPSDLNAEQVLVS